MTVTLYGDKDLSGVMKKLLMGRLSWIICVGLKGDHRYSVRRRQRGISDNRGEDGMITRQRLEGGGHKPRNVSSHQELDEARNGSSSDQ